MLDLHTHHAPPPGTQAIVNRSYGRPFPETPWFSAGLHPWYLEGMDLGAALEWVGEQAKLPGCKAIGEAGLDRVCATEWALQERAFAGCIELALAHRLDLIIHCVRAFEEVLFWKKKVDNAGEIKWIFHGFNRKPDLAQRLLDAGCYLSFGAAILRPDSPAAQSLRHCPEGRYFLETDDRADVAIEQVYAAAAQLRAAAH
jgi:TatD DNase family protein